MNCEYWDDKEDFTILKLHLWQINLTNPPLASLDLLSGGQAKQIWMSEVCQ